MKTHRHKSKPDELLDEYDMHVALLLVGVVKELARMRNQTSGEMPCPRCKTGKLRWSIASNGHARVVCDRIVGTQKSGEPIRCINAME